MRSSTKTRTAHGARPWAIAAMMLALASSARADVVPPPPDQCPADHTPATGHGGPYCRPPARTDCPPGYKSRVYERDAYCEPPPQEPCPPGSDWTSLSAGDGFCIVGSSCRQDACGPDATCVPTSYCLDWTCFRCSMSRITGLCRTDADCDRGYGYSEEDPERPRCVHQYLCDPKVKRVAASYQAPMRAEPPAPIVLSVLPVHELASCGYESCPSGQLCLPLSLCVGIGPTGSGTPQAGVTPIMGSCAGDTHCSGRSTCIRSFRCVDAQALGPTRNGRPVTAEPSPQARLPEPIAGASGAGPAARRGGCAACATTLPESGSRLWLAGLGVLAAFCLLLRRTKRTPRG